jgi:hypothetical protein
MAIGKDAAETIGLNALTWLVGNDELLPIFLGSTGAGVDDLRGAVTDPAMQGAVLDFLLMDDAWVAAFAEAYQLPYEQVMQARMSLPGGEQVHWT